MLMVGVGGGQELRDGAAGIRRRAVSSSQGLGEFAEAAAVKRLDLLGEPVPARPPHGAGASSLRAASLASTGPPASSGGFGWQAGHRGSPPGVSSRLRLGAQPRWVGAGVDAAQLGEHRDSPRWSLPGGFGEPGRPPPR
ncbi:hypothetical protein HBB16_14130 [Pseudonocardia sp. MCCB 268]|nr:hypothetical protein [Pseudonocardia cytotoxica]